MSSIISSWRQHIEGLTPSTQDFYSRIEEVVKTKKIPDVAFERVTMKEGGMMSAKREYLRIKRKDMWFDVCGAPFANGFFVSERLVVEEEVPEDAILKAVFSPDTYYKRDTTSMFQHVVHRSILEAVDSLTDAAKLPKLPESERKPMMLGFYQ